jgi:glycopeptide antibiotics resistance protein
MPSTTQEIPTLLVVVPLGAVALAVMLWWLHRRAALTALRASAGVVACGYGAGVVANTLLPIYIGETGDRPPWSVFLNLVPLVNTDPRDMLQNVVVFLPLGVLLPVVARVSSALRILLLGFLLSLTMEGLQLLNAVTGHGGHVADVNDLLANTLGAPLGYGIFRCALLVPLVARLVSAATWPAPNSGLTRRTPSAGPPPGPSTGSW